MNSTPSKKKIKSETETTPDAKKTKKNLKRKSSEGSVASILTDASALNSGKKKKKKDPDSNFEKAVKVARGVPDGNSPNPEKGGKHKSFEKGKKKPLNAIRTAALKLKKWGRKGESNDKPKIGGKRKHETGEGSALEEMKFKDRKKQRRTMKDNYQIALEAKSLWEQLRRHNVTAEKRVDLTNRLFELVQGKAKELIFAHDTSRVIQCLMKYGSNEHKNALFDELKDDIVLMMKTRYAKFFVRKVLKCGTKEQRTVVFKCMYGNVRKLIRHQEAAELVELAYNDFANAQERSSLIEEFYGPSFALFKTEGTRTLQDILTSHPEKQDAILTHTKDTLTALVNKSLCHHSIVHKVFLDYITLAPEKARTEMIETVRESLIHMLHTRDGARVAMQCLWNGTAKDRKVIVKSMKTYVEKVCKEEYGHLVLLCIFDVVDDTKLVQKVILEEMLKAVQEVAEDLYGRKVLLYLLCPRSPKHFAPDIVKVLHEGDNNPTSKKPVSVRRGELLAAVSKPLIKFAKEHIQELVTNNASLLLFISIMEHAQGDVSEAMRALAEIAAKPYVANIVEDSHIVEHPFGHVALKRLIGKDSEEKDKSAFANILVETVPEVNFKTWTSCNRGCFILASLLELGDPPVTKTIKRALKSVRPHLRKMEFKGAEILASRLEELD